MEANRRTALIAVAIAAILLISIFTMSSVFDLDDDGVYNWSDNCPETSNSDQDDTDADDSGDACDDDDDGDGIDDSEDLFPLDASESTDFDADGVGDNSDPDFDGDGVENGEDTFPFDPAEWLDTDGDEIGDNADADDDGDGLDDQADPFPLTPKSALDELGPFRVGTDDFTFTASTGITLKVQVWYPTSDETGERVIYDNLYPGDAWDRATPDCSQTHPVVLYSHGTGSGLRWMSGFLVEWLTSHGFVVVAPDHVDDNLFDFDFYKLPDTLLRRPIDLRDSYDWMVSESEGDGDFSDCIDGDAGYAVMGHSGGGYTSLTASGATIAIANLTAECDDGEDAACQMRDTWLEANPGTDTIDLSDDRIWATVALAPWTGLVLDEGLADIDTPVMVLTGDIDETTNISMVTGIVDEIETDVLHFGIIAGAGHHQFSPLGCETYGCEGQIENNITMDLTNASVIVFFAQLLDWPDADTYAFPETEYIEWQ